MENTARLNPNLAAAPRAGYFIEKVHRCADCPIRRLATARPHSVFARMHGWHRTWWPGWKVHQARACAFAAAAASQSRKS